MQRFPKYWGESWINPNKDVFLKLCKHNMGEYNNLEWHLSLSYNQLLNDSIVKDENTKISTIISEKYCDPGHIRRIDFVHFLNRKNFPIDIYGTCEKWNFQNYKGTLPSHCKENGLLSYKYTFNAENTQVRYYFTEKIIDAILCECLIFYWGCPNIEEFIDPRAFVRLDLSNFSHDLQIIQKAIDEDWYTQRLPYIKAEKKKILNQLQFFPRIENIINQNERQKLLSSVKNAEKIREKYNIKITN
jgi:hypothetical protein